LFSFVGNVLNILVLVAFKLFIDKIELVDNEFKLLNLVVDIVFQLLIDNMITLFLKL
jgi:hypothetical protein